MTDDQKPPSHEQLLAGLDQGSALLRDYLIPMLKSFYDSLVDVGFKEEHAIFLTTEFMKLIVGKTYDNPK